MGRGCVRGATREYGRCETTASCCGVHPRRSIYRVCSKVPGRRKTHVLLPKLALLRRADTVKVIGEALTATHVDKRTRREVAAEAKAPLDTVRGWRRRFGERAEEIRVQFTELAHEWDSEQAAIGARASPELDALEAIGVAVRAAVRRFGPEPPGQLVSGASAGRLLCHASSPLPLRSSAPDHDLGHVAAESLAALFNTLPAGRTTGPTGGGPPGYARQPPGGPR